MNPFPNARFSGTEDTLDDTHIAERIFERHRHLAVLLYGFGEEIALNRVLIAGCEFLYTRAFPSKF